MTVAAQHQGVSAPAEEPRQTVSTKAPSLHALDPSPSERSPSVAELADAMEAFVQSKGWYAPDSRRPQTPRNLAASIVIEASELLECFQWNDIPERHHLEEELADVMLYALQLANVMKVDLAAVVSRKLQVNQARTWDDA